MFASKSLPEHLARGVVGLGTFGAAVFLAPREPWLALAALPVAFVALRGCPTCWLVGLVQTVAPGSKMAGTCVDGRCVKPPASKL